MSNTKNNISFFLGANSAGGFVSLYDTWIDQKKTRRLFTSLRAVRDAGSLR